MSADKGKDAKMDWEAIHGLMEDAIYGGRIDNAYDLRVLRAYLRYTGYIISHIYCICFCDYFCHSPCYRVLERLTWLFVASWCGISSFPLGNSE